MLTGLALVQEGKATDIRDQQEAGVITIEQRDDYNSAVTTRDDFVLAAGITAAAGAAVTLIGLVLYLFDEPTVALPARRAPEEESPDEQPTEVELVGAPLVGPGLGGVGLSGRF